jgi:hypothetical protein
VRLEVAAIDIFDEQTGFNLFSSIVEKN